MMPKADTKDPDLLASFAALKRAAKNARKLSIATNTPFLVWQDGKVVDLNKKRKPRRTSRTRKR